MKWLAPVLLQNLEILIGPSSGFHVWGQKLADAHDEISKEQGQYWSCHMEGRHKNYSGGAWSAKPAMSQPTLDMRQP